MPILRQWSLILLCFSMACAVGGGLYEHLVLTPLWSRSPAASGRAGILHDHARLERLLLHTRDAGFSEGPSGFSANCGPHGTGGSVDLLDMVQGTPRHRVFLVLSVGPLLAAELTLMLARGLCHGGRIRYRRDAADGVQRALGRAPRDFTDYARRTAATGVWAG
jgi:hypothetical protein